MDWQVHRFDSLDSTNTWLVSRAGDLPEGSVAVADVQTAGRGRLGRTWVAPPGASLLCSILLKPPASAVHLVTPAVAVAARAALLEVAGFEAGIKWPNDLLYEGRKLAGVLAEAALPAVVVGIGINLNWGSGLPDDLSAIAVSADGIAGRPVDREQVLGAMLAALDTLLASGWDEVARQYRRACITVGTPVRVILHDEEFTGTAADINDAGHLLVDVGMCLREVTAADVVHLR